jgi:large subunit ribosomal protein L29
MLEVDSLKNQSVGELVKLSQKLSDELVQAKFQHATQQYKTPHKLRQMRRDIARVKTLATQKRQALPVKAAAPKAVKAAPAPKARKAPKAEKVAKAPKAEGAKKASKKKEA